MTEADTEQNPESPSVGDQQEAPKTATGLEPNLAGALTYALMPVTGIVFLVLEPDHKFIRFHSFQSTITGFVALIGWMIIRFFPFLGFFMGFIYNLLILALWIILIYKAYNNEEWELPVIGEISRNQLESK